MKHKRFSVEQVVAVLKQPKAGVPLAELIRRVEISEQTFYQGNRGIDSGMHGRMRKRSIERLPGYRLGKYWRFRADEVLAWVECHREGSHAA